MSQINTTCVQEEFKYEVLFGGNCCILHSRQISTQDTCTEALSFQPKQPLELSYLS